MGPQDGTSGGHTALSVSSPVQSRNAPSPEAGSRGLLALPSRAVMGSLLITDTSET